jgi:phosphohistidine phosphatase
MQLYFFRHAQAEDAQMPDFDDFARQLTDKGIQRTRLAAAALLTLGVELTRLYSSPRLRARQTADILAKALKLEVAVREEVGFSFSNQELEKLIGDVDNAHSVLFVGHEPSLSSTISMLVGGGELVMKKGGLARVDIYSRSPLKGTLVWMLSPKVLDHLGQD